MDFIKSIIKKLVDLTEMFNEESDLNRYIFGMLSYLNKYFKMGQMLSNAIQTKKSYKRFVGDFEDDEDVELAENFAKILDRFAESMSEVFEFNASELEKDFPELTQVLTRQGNFIPNSRRQKFTRNSHHKHGKHDHKHHKHSSKQVKASKQQSDQKPAPKWESMGRKLTFLPNHDNFHDEIPI